MHAEYSAPSCMLIWLFTIYFEKIIVTLQRWVYSFICTFYVGQRHLWVDYETYVGNSFPKANCLVLYACGQDRASGIAGSWIMLRLRSGKHGGASASDGIELFLVGSFGALDREESSLHLE